MGFNSVFKGLKQYICTFRHEQLTVRVQYLYFSFFGVSYYLFSTCLRNERTAFNRFVAVTCF